MLIEYQTVTGSYVVVNQSGSSLPVTDADRLTKMYPHSFTLPSAGTASLVANGGVTASFGSNVTDILITYTDGAVYISPDSSSINVPSSGSLNGRVYIPYNASGLALPWTGNKVYVINAVASTTPTLHVVGYAK